MSSNLLREPSVTSTREHDEGQYFVKNLRHFMKLYWRYVFAYIWPILCLLVFIFGTNVKIRCLYIAVVMYGYWTSDVFPEGITALIPLFLLPMMMIQNTYTTCTIYFQYGIFVVNAVLLAICLEHTGILERIILFIILKFGGGPRAAHSVMSTVCALISIRNANTYTVVLMLPIINKILYEIDIKDLDASEVQLSTVNFNLAGKEKRPVNLSLAFCSGVIYASDLGGINFVTGSITNFAFTASYQRRYPNCAIAQTPWYMYTAPVSTIIHIFTILWVQMLHLGLWRCDRRTLSEYKHLSRAFKEQKIIETLYKRLGKISLGEICVGVAYVIYVILWYIDDVLYFQENKEYFLVMFITDSTPFFCITFGLMLLPANTDFLKSCSRNKARSQTRASPRIIAWNVLQTKIPWGRVLLLGSFVAMAQAQFTTGLAKDMASLFSFMKDCNYWTLLFVVTLFANLITETCSNGIVCGVFSPLVIEFAILCKVHPVYLGLPFAVVCSFGMVTRYASLNIKRVIDNASLPEYEFFLTGIFPKMFAWLMIYVTFEPYGKIFMHEDAVFPKDFLNLNETCYCKPCPFMNSTSRDHYW